MDNKHVERAREMLAHKAGEETYLNLMKVQTRTGRSFSPEYIAMAVVQDALKAARDQNTVGKDWQAEWERNGRPFCTDPKDGDHSLRSHPPLSPQRGEVEQLREVVSGQVIAIHKAFGMYGYDVYRCDIATNAILAALSPCQRWAGGGPWSAGPMPTVLPPQPRRRAGWCDRGMCCGG